IARNYAALLESGGECCLLLSEASCHLPKVSVILPAETKRVQIASVSSEVPVKHHRGQRDERIHRRRCDPEPIAEESPRRQSVRDVLRQPASIDLARRPKRGEHPRTVDRRPQVSSWPESCPVKRLGHGC